METGIFLFLRMQGNYSILFPGSVIHNNINSLTIKNKNGI